MKVIVPVTEMVVPGHIWTTVPAPPELNRLLIVVWSPEERQAAAANPNRGNMARAWSLEAIVEGKSARRGFEYAISSTVFSTK